MATSPERNAANTHSNNYNNNGKNINSFALFNSVHDTQSSSAITIRDIADACKHPEIIIPTDDSQDALKEAKLSGKAFTACDATGKTKEAVMNANFSALVTDIDSGNKSLDDVKGTLADLQAPCVIYSTYSATSEAKRWRVVIPLVSPINAEQYAELNHGLSIVLGGDAAMKKIAQVSFMPAKRSEDAYFKHNATLDTSAWVDPKDDSHLLISAVREAYQAFVDERDKVATEATVVSRAVVCESASIIVLINNAYPDIRQILEQHGYRSKGRHYLAPSSESKIPGVRILKRDGKEVVYSHHSQSDPLSALNHGGHSLDVADVLCVLKYGGDFRQMIREEAGLLDPEGQKQRQREFARREEQKAENKHIQEDGINTSPPRMTIEDMLNDCVWISDGSQVAFRSKPGVVFNLNDFSNCTASCQIEENTPRGPRMVPVSKVWLKSEYRCTVNTRTFHAGADLICKSPDGLPAINSWRPIERRPSNADIEPFLKHVEYLFGSDADKFLDWLAHIEQKPGELPHYGWLHIAEHTGTGRNWLASILARVWRGYVAPNVDIPDLLDNSFNGVLAGRILATADEIQEGGGENRFRHTSKLKSIVNEEHRLINPKYGRQYVEFNSCRWLVFSNHVNALPITSTDRRWWVVRNKGQHNSPEYYTSLYSLIHDPEFINAVAVHLSKRDISAFNPGERPPMTDAKLATIDASKSEMVRDAEQLAADYPCDLITNKQVVARLSGGYFASSSLTPAMCHALMDAKCERYRNGNKVKVDGENQKVWILRNHEEWKKKQPSEIAAELSRYKQAA